MKAIIFLFLICIPCLLPGQQQTRHKEEKQLILDGTWIVEGGQRFLGTDTFYSTSDSLIETYFQFGESLNSLTVVSFIKKDKKYLDLNLIDQFYFYDSSGVQSTKNPVRLEYNGHWCHLMEGWFMNWNIVPLGDGKIMLTDTVFYDTIRYVTNRVLKKISTANKVEKISYNDQVGKWKVDKCDLSLKYFSDLKFEITDSLITQHYKRRHNYSSDSTYYPVTVTCRYHTEDFMGHKLMVADDYSIYIWFFPDGESSMWIAANNGCNFEILGGSYHLLKQ